MPKITKEGIQYIEDNRGKVTQTEMSKHLGISLSQVNFYHNNWGASPKMPKKKSTRIKEIRPSRVKKATDFDDGNGFFSIEKFASMVD